MGVRQRHRQHFKFDRAACGSEDAGALKWNNSASFTPALHMKGETLTFASRLGLKAALRLSAV